MNTGHLQVARAEKAQQEDKHTPGARHDARTMDMRKLKTLEAFGDPDLGAIRIIFDESKLPAFGAHTGGKSTDGVTTDAERAAELVKRWNAYPRLMEALKTIESKLHEGDEEDGSDDGEFIQDVRNLSGDYIGQLQDLGTIARGAIAVAAQ